MQLQQTTPERLCLLTLFCFKVDKVKAKDRLLDITAILTCGMVNGCQIRVRPVIKAPGDLKLSDLESVDEENDRETERCSELNLQLSKEQLKAPSSQQGWPHFKDVFMLSSVDREDVETLKVHKLTLFNPVFVLQH